MGLLNDVLDAATVFTVAGVIYVAANEDFTPKYISAKVISESGTVHEAVDLKKPTSIFSSKNYVLRVETNQGVYDLNMQERPLLSKDNNLEYLAKSLSIGSKIEVRKEYLPNNFNGFMFVGNYEVAHINIKK